MKGQEYEEYYSYVHKENIQQIFLATDEYAEVMSEINSHMSDEDREKQIVAKPIGNHVYVFINRGYNDYIFIGKYPIDDDR